MNSGLGANLTHNVNRWYEVFTGSYSRPDPLGILKGEENLYLYAKASPVRYFDLLGLVTYIGFSADQERDARQAVQIVRQRLAANPCCLDPGDGKPADLLSYLDSPDFKIRFKSKLKLCGKTPTLTMLAARRRIFVGPLAWGQSCCSGGQAGVNGLASTILHELVHAANSTTRHAKASEKRCFGCG